MRNTKDLAKLGFSLCPYGVNRMLPKYQKEPASKAGSM